VVKAPNRITDNRYLSVVVRVTDSVPAGIEHCVSFSTSDPFEPVIIPVTVGKETYQSTVKSTKHVSKMNFHIHKEKGKEQSMSLRMHQRNTKVQFLIAWKLPKVVIFSCLISAYQV
jgi:hypothetical protein